MVGLVPPVYPSNRSSLVQRSSAISCKDFGIELENGFFRAVKAVNEMPFRVGNATRRCCAIGQPSAKPTNLITAGSVRLTTCVFQKFTTRRQSPVLSTRTWSERASDAQLTIVMIHPRPEVGLITTSGVTPATSPTNELRMRASCEGPNARRENIISAPTTNHRPHSKVCQSCSQLLRTPSVGCLLTN